MEGICESMLVIDGLSDKGARFEAVLDGESDGAGTAETIV